jgi:hypothetical protein
LDGWDNSKPEHAEESVFEAISELAEGGLIRLDDGEDTTLSVVLRELCGSTSALVEKAEKFEQSISGYEGQVEWDDMEDAYYMLEGIAGELAVLGKKDESHERTLFSDVEPKG